MKWVGGEYLLSNGERLQANCGILGLSPDLGLYEGYDGVPRYGDPFTAEERREIADMMIARWKEWAEKEQP